jgi:hypothetical protein
MQRLPRKDRKYFLTSDQPKKVVLSEKGDNIPKKGRQYFLRMIQHL